MLENNKSCLIYTFFLISGKPYCLSASKSWRRSSDSSVGAGTSTNDTLMDGGFDAIKHFQVELWELVFLVGRGFLDITKRRGIDNVADNESLDGLVLGDGLSSGNTTNTLDVSASVLVAAVVASLDGHD